MNQTAKVQLGSSLNSKSCPYDCTTRYFLELARVTSNLLFPNFTFVSQMCKLISTKTSFENISAWISEENGHAHI